MEHQEWLDEQARISLARLLPRCNHVFKSTKEKKLFHTRLDREFPRLFSLLHKLYGNQYDFFYHLEQILLTAAQFFTERSNDLKQLDRQREANPLWFQSEKMVGGVCYVDLFAGTLEKMHDALPYYEELGLTYLHLMPLFKAPEKNSDGGYAVSDYRSVNPKIGTMPQLAQFASALRKAGISLVLDFVFNHTSNEHEWAQRARAGEPEYRQYYHLFEDRVLPDAYEQTLREIFPEQAPGNFTYLPDIDHWVWTSFYSFQWDLNYRNPAVFNAMLGEMLFLANQGVEVLRLDAVAFIWKEYGTSCENRPEAHLIIQAYNALIKIVAPAMLFKSEAIVHPSDVASYISADECPISYNPTLMALLWESLATRKVALLQQSMSLRFGLPQDCAWVNYVRVHDDIGWTFADEDAAEIGINGYEHRKFLNRFYMGEFEGSFSIGLPFGYNPIKHDMRICGTAASLAGLEQALAVNDDLLIEMALRRLLLIHSVIISAGGIPLLYLGDEIASLNDYSFREHPDKKDDNRWVHRGTFDYERAALRHDPRTIPGRMFSDLVHLLTIRNNTPAMGSDLTTFFSTQNEHVLGYNRGGRLLILANFSERDQIVRRDTLAAYGPAQQTLLNLLTNEMVELPSEIQLQPYEFMWLQQS